MGEVGGGEGRMHAGGTTVEGQGVGHGRPSGREGKKAWSASHHSRMWGLDEYKSCDSHMI